MHKAWKWKEICSVSKLWKSGNKEKYGLIPSDGGSCSKILESFRTLDRIHTAIQYLILHNQVNFFHLQFYQSQNVWRGELWAWSLLNSRHSSFPRHVYMLLMSKSIQVRIRPHFAVNIWRRIPLRHRSYSPPRILLYWSEVWGHVTWFLSFMTAELATINLRLF